MRDRERMLKLDARYLDALIPFELRYIGQPLLVWLARMEVSVKEILGYILRILCPPRTAVVVVIDGGLDALGPADAKNALVIHMDIRLSNFLWFAHLLRLPLPLYLG